MTHHPARILLKLAPGGLALLASLCVAAVTPAWAGVIPVHVNAYLPDSRPNAPVSFGVPFPQDALMPQNVDGIRLVDDQGKVIPHQAAITATWDPEAAHGVRWLLVDALVDPGHEYSLRFGDDAPADSITQRDIARVHEGMIEFETGACSGRMPTARFDPFLQMRCLGLPLTADDLTMPEGSFSAFYVEHETRGIFRSDLDADATVILEETGPVRATIKADGWYTNTQGERFCRYSIRMHFYRGRPDVKIEHTFIYTGLSSEDRIAAMGLKLVRALPEDGKKARLYAGGADVLAGDFTDSTGRMHVIQDASERGRLDYWSPREDGSVIKWGDHGGGYFYMLGSYGMSAAIRDAWQQYPWALQVTDGLVDVQLWPRGVRLLDTSWDGYWHMLTDRQKRYMAGSMSKADEDVDAWMARLRKATNATGAAKTHELWLSFMGPEYNRIPDGSFAITGDLGREVAYPVYAYADPAWVCAAEALDWQPHTPRDVENFPKEEAFLEAMLTMMQEVTRINGWFGWWDWGGYHQHLWPGPRSPRFGLWADDAGMEKWHRARPKSHYHWGRFPWVQFMRTGERRWLRYAQTYTLYAADRAHTHHTGHGRANGGEFHYDNSVVPWMGGYQGSPSGDQLASNLQAKDDYVYAYWLTGNRRPLDVLKANGELFKDAHAKGSSHFKYKPGFARGNDIRNAGMLLERNMMLYQATWDEKYLAIARDVAAAFTPLDTAEKVRVAEFSAPEVPFHQAATWAYQGMWFYDRIAQDPAFHHTLKLFIERSRDFTAGFPGTGNARAYTYGYLLTGDTTYLDLGRSIWDDLITRSVTPNQFLPAGKQALSPMPGFLALMKAAPQGWREKNLPTHQRGGTLTWRYYTWNHNPHLPGTRAFFRDDADKAWGFTLTTKEGGTFELRAPDGSVARSVTLDEKYVRWARFDVPSDGMKGDYMLICTKPSPTTEASRSSDRQALARVLGCNVPVVVQAAAPGTASAVIGRSMYFQVAAAPAQAALTVGPLDAQRAAILSSVDGAWQVSTEGVVPLRGRMYRIVIPPALYGKALRLTFDVRADEYYLPDRNRPRYIELEGIEPFVAGQAEYLFVPLIAEAGTDG